MVHVSRPGVVLLQCVADPDWWLGIYDGRVLGEVYTTVHEQTFIVHYFRYKKDNQKKKQRDKTKKGTTKHTHKQNNKKDM